YDSTHQTDQLEGPMLNLEEAVERILRIVPSSSSEWIDLTLAHGRFLAEQILAPIELPPFDNSAMDGYAVRAADVTSAAPDKPVRLRCVGKVPAGQVFEREMITGQCVRLFTGSPLPNGADAVFMQEDTRVDSNDPSTVLFLDGAKPWENVRFRGEDAKRGAVLAESGQKLTATHLTLLAA